MSSTFLLRIGQTADRVADIGRRRYPAGPAPSHRREEGADLANEHFHPEIEPYRTGRLQVDDLHTLYYEECGTPDGLPMLFVHGGPGAGCTTTDRRFFDSNRFRTVLFDQRGCGRSTPHASVTDNTTWHLVADIELIRSTLGIDKWMVFGGSWGATLALIHA